MSTKVVLVTGATSGIGQETAELLAAEGWKVVVSGRRKEEGEKVVAGIKSKGGEAAFVQADLSTEAAAKDLVDKVVQLYGRIDGAVNNAGIATDAAIFHELSSEKFENMLRLNVLGVFWCMQYQIKEMLKAKSGSIVNLASIAGLNGIKMNGSYVATKHAVVGMTKSAAIDYGTQGIRVNAVAPGAIKTPILRYAIDNGLYSEESISEMFPMKRMGDPKDIATAISFLLSNNYATGTILSVDGGFDAA